MHHLFGMAGNMYFTVTLLLCKANIRVLVFSFQILKTEILWLCNINVLKLLAFKVTVESELVMVRNPRV